MEKEGDALVDPLASYWGLSLFPQPSLPPSKPYNSDQDLHIIHTHLRSMALRSPAKLMQQAKSIVDGNPQLFNTENLNDPTSQNTNVAEEDGEFRRNPRPGLGLKRPRFSMKPTKKPSVESLLPTLDLDSLKDPADFFMAHERLENAKREIQKQLGGASFESDQDKAAARPRQRRPGLLGNDQLSIKYKHRYPKETSDDVLSSQETLGSRSLAPVTENTDKGESCMASLEKEVIDSSGTEGNKLDELLDGLLHCNSEDLEGDGAMTLLQERLQIKPIALEKFSVPDFPDKQMVDLKSLQGNKSKPRKALSDIDNLLKGMNMNKKTPLKKAVQCPGQQLASPTPPRSPFASLSLLQRHISRSKQSVDPFSAHEIDNLSSKNYSLTHTVNPELNLAGSGNLSNELNAHMIEDVHAVGKTSTVLDTDRNGTNTSEIPKEDYSGKSSNKWNAPSTEDIIAVGGNSLPEDTVRNGTSTSQKFIVDNSREPKFDVNIVSNEPHVDMDVDVGASGMGDNVDRSNIEAHMIEDDIAVGKTSTVLDTDINSIHTSEISKEDNSGKSSNNLNVPSIDNIVAADGTSLAEDAARNCTSTFQKSMVDNSRDPRLDVTIDSHESHVDMGVDVGVSGVADRVMDDTEDRSNIEVNESCQSEDKSENIQTFTASIPTDDTNLNVLNSLGYEANAVDKRARTSDDDPEHCLQEKTDGSVVAVNGQKRVKSRVQKVSKNKKLSNRQSLAAAGTSWTSGLRRSTRIRTRPLEYWKGERPVYGRVHQSLATVIGVKCISPGSDGKPIMKVKSYVSNKYKELFELASLY
ncbi:Centromere protein C isoform B [Glycine soja]|uniref:Centromere protein C isoform B n=1 Tax=Glycine soja TaxID=3848 RepID=A0A0B2NU95_GLYSO|nr:hypothetical protein glysoja_030830 [Glycine soja]RZB62438.1 Centromere protein C isoform B [Glycine soja]